MASASQSTATGPIKECWIGYPCSGRGSASPGAGRQESGRWHGADLIRRRGRWCRSPTRSAANPPRTRDIPDLRPAVASGDRSGPPSPSRPSFSGLARVHDHDPPVLCMCLFASLQQPARTLTAAGPHRATGPAFLSSPPTSPAPPSQRWSPVPGRAHAAPAVTAAPGRPSTSGLRHSRAGREHR